MTLSNLSTSVIETSSMARLVPVSKSREGTTREGGPSLLPFRFLAAPFGSITKGPALDRDPPRIKASFYLRPNQSINGGERHGFVGKDLVPFT